MVAACQAGACVSSVGRLASGWLILAEQQVLTGYCLLLPDPVVPHLNALTAADRVQFLTDMGAVGDALLHVTGAVRINYAIFGNVEPALHAHLFPRRVDEAEAVRTLQPWGLDWNAAPRYSDAAHGVLRNGLRQSLLAGGTLKEVAQ